MAKAFLWTGIAALIFGAILFNALMPGFDSRPTSSRAQCLNNGRQLGLAMLNYEAAFRKLPPAVTLDDDGKLMHSWRTMLMPYLEMGGLYREIRREEPWDSPHNRKFLRAIEFEPSNVRYYIGRCPACEGVSGSAALKPAWTNYFLLTGPGTIYPGAQPLPLEAATDGLGQTILLIEMARTDIAWTEPRDISREEFLRKFAQVQETGDGQILSAHKGGLNVFMLDGSAKFLSFDTPIETVRALTTIAAGESIPDQG